MKHSGKTSRRHILQIGAAAIGGGLLAQQKTLAAETPGKLGEPLGPYGDRSPFEKAVRWRRESKTPETGSSFTPLEDSVGTVTPSSLHCSIGKFYPYGVERPSATQNDKEKFTGYLRDSATGL